MSDDSKQNAVDLAVEAILGMVASGPSNGTVDRDRVTALCDNAALEIADDWTARAERVPEPVRSLLICFLELFRAVHQLAPEQRHQFPREYKQLVHCMEHVNEILLSWENYQEKVHHAN